MELSTIIVKNLTGSSITIGSFEFVSGNNTLFDVNVGSTYKPARNILLNNYDDIVNNTICGSPKFEVTVNGIPFTTRYHFGAFWDDIESIRRGHDVGFNSINFSFYFDPEDLTFNVKCPMTGKVYKVQMIERI